MQTKVSSKKRPDALCALILCRHLFCGTQHHHLSPCMMQEDILLQIWRSHSPAFFSLQQSLASSSFWTINLTWLFDPLPPSLWRLTISSRLTKTLETMCSTNGHKTSMSKMNLGAHCNLFCNAKRAGPSQAKRQRLASRQVVVPNVYVLAERKGNVDGMPHQTNNAVLDYHNENGALTIDLVM